MYGVFGRKMLHNKFNEILLQIKLKTYRRFPGSSRIASKTYPEKRVGSN